MNAFSCSGAVVPVETPVTQNTFIAVSRKVVFVCQRLKYVPVNLSGFSAAAKPLAEKFLHIIGFWIAKKIGNFSTNLIHK